MIKEDNKTEEYNNIKAIYLNYTDIMDKSEHSKSLTRYQFELNMLKNMFEYVKDGQNAEELKYVNDKYEALSSNLKTRFGVIVKKLSDSDN